MIKEAMLDVIDDDVIVNVLFDKDDGDDADIERAKRSNWQLISGNKELTIKKISVPTRRTVKLYTEEDLRRTEFIRLTYKYVDDVWVTDSFK